MGHKRTWTVSFDQLIGGAIAKSGGTVTPSALAVFRLMNILEFQCPVHREVARFSGVMNSRRTEITSTPWRTIWLVISVLSGANENG
jgi:hypothetical protein